MRRILPVLPLFLLLTGTVHAQGIGVAYGNRVRQISYTFYENIYIIEERNEFWITAPIRLNERWTLEPQVTGDMVRQHERSDMILLAGASVRVNPSPASDVFYVGLQAFANGITTGDYFHVSLGPIAGGEYFLNDTFSLGAEASLLATAFDVLNLPPGERQYAYTFTGMMLMRAYWK